MASVTLKNVKKTYQSEKGKASDAIRHMDLEVKDGEFMVLVGPSGSGKSTVLRMIAGLEDVTEGDIFIGGSRVNDLEPKDRDIAMVFQNYALYPHMTVYNNMAFALKNKGFSKDQIDSKVRGAAEVLGITEYLKRKPKSLSGGERQRVAIGRAIVRDPRVFLLDEPLSNLDAALRSQMRAELMRLRQKIHSTFIYVTHDQIEAMTLGDRVVVLKDGLVQQIGTPYEVYDHPANTFVAGFIGTPQMNFLDAALYKDGGALALKLADTLIPVTKKKGEALLAGGAAPGRVTAGVRPDDMTLCEEGEEGALSASVRMFEMMGSSVHLHLSCCGSDITVMAARADEKGYPIAGFKPGDRVFVKPDPGAVHVFDANTGKNLEARVNRDE